GEVCMRRVCVGMKCGVCLPTLLCRHFLACGGVCVYIYICLCFSHRKISDLITVGWNLFQWAYSGK
uniref:Uncharacterized protein n=1 Tax=Astyanax mexicanus TaxID=7994 RepID=A0A8B9RM38_ASTMX